MRLVVPTLSVALAVLFALPLGTSAQTLTIDGGDNYTIVLKPDGTVWTFGDNSAGQVGDGTNTNRWLPTQVSLTNVVAVAAGSGHGVAVKSDGSVWSWGWNAYGQMGNGTTSWSTTPQQAGSFTNVVAVAAGHTHTVALTSSGTVYTWGNNDYGQLGDGSTTQSTSPALVSGLSGVVAIGAGLYHTLAVKSDGTVVAWGYNGYGQLGDGTTTNRNSPTAMSTITTATAIVGGNYHTLIRQSDGSLKATGQNVFGQLGNGNTWNATSPVTVSNLSNVAMIAAGEYHSVAVKSDGTVYTWGYNWNGQIGDGTQTDRHSPTSISTLGDGELVAAGFQHTVVVDVDGVVRSVGFNSGGRLGDGTNIRKLSPVAISVEDYEWKAGTPYFDYNTGTFSQTITETVHTKTQSGTIRYTTDGSEPTESSNSIASGGSVNVTENTTIKARTFKSGVPPSNTAVAVYTFIPHTPQFSPSGGTYTSAPTVGFWSNTSGVVYRYTTDGSTPTGSSAQYTGPISITTTTMLKAISTRAGWSNSDVQSAMFTMSFGTLPAPTMTPAGGTYTSSAEVTLEAAAGAAIYYTTDGSTPTEASYQYTAPLTVTANTTVKAKAYRIDYTASGVTTQTYNINTAAPTFNPAAGAYTANQAITISTATAGATIRYTTTGADPTESSASIPSGGTLIVGNYTLKAKTFKSGNGASPVSSAVYTATTELGERLAAGGAYSLAVQSDGGGWAWGYNAYGQLGDGTSTSRNTPVEILGSTGVVGIAGKENHSLAVRSDGAVFAWGANENGQLGVGTTYSASLHPQAVSTLSSGVLAVAAGGTHSLALKSDGTVVAWGGNAEGQLGDGTTVQRTSPVAVANLSGITAIAAGYHFSMALKGDGTVWTWGYNTNGQLGDGTTTQRSLPVQVSGITNAVAISAGSSHAIAVLSDGTAKSWGLGWYGNLGNGYNGSSSTPVSMSGVTSAIAAAAGTFHSLVLNLDGSVRAFGYNAHGQLGNGTTNESWSGTTPVGLPPVEQIAAGNYHSLAMTSDGTVWAWGVNTNGQLGDRSNTERRQPVAISTADLTWSLPAPLFNTQSGLFYDVFNVTVTSPDASATIRYTTDGNDPVSTSTTVASGATVSIPQTLTLKASAWLSGSPTSHVTTASYVLKAVTPQMSPSSGAYGSSQSVSMATTTSGATIRYTIDGSEPTSVSSVYSAPIAVAANQTVKAVAFKTGWTSSDSGFASYWVSAGTTAAPTFTPGAGTYSSAQLVTISTASSGASIRFTLDGTAPTSTSPLYVYPFVVDATTTLKAVAFKPGFTASTITSGTFVLDASGAAETPVLAPAGGTYATNRTVTITGAAGTTLRYTTDGTTPDESDTVITSGNTVTIDRSTVLKVRAWKTGVTPSAVRRADYVITGALAAGDYHTLALKSDGTVWAWGWNEGIGDGTGVHRLSPVQVLSGAVAIAAGANRSVAVKSDGTVWAWGAGAPNPGTPTQISTTGFTNIVAVSAGATHQLALKADGTVWSWGTNANGQLGDGTTANRALPVQVPGLSGVTAILAAGESSYAIGSDGASTGVVWSWGRNNHGQLGDGSTLTRMSPVIIGTLSNVAAISGGFNWAMALKSDGTVWAWGSNASGVLGRYSTAPSTTPVRVEPLRRVVQIAGGASHALATTDDGRLWGWGALNAQIGAVNYSFQVGISFIWVPQLVNAEVIAPVAIAGGAQHSVFIKPDGSVWSIGTGYALGNGVGGYSEIPVAASGLVLATNTLLSSDTDGDGLIGWREYLAGSDPLNSDTNGNGVSDGVEVGNAAADPENPDTDGDGMANWVEVAAGTDPFNTDTDGDTVNDHSDAFPLDPSRSSPPTGNPSDTTPPTITLTEPTNAVLVP